jgi:hypothetical protein
MAGRSLYSKLGFLTIEKRKVRDDLDAAAMLYEPPALKGRWLEVNESLIRVWQSRKQERGNPAQKKI